MHVELLPNIYDAAIVNMPNWLRISGYLEGHPIQSDKMKQVRKSHGSTRTKIVFADYHYHILNQVYVPKETKRLNETPMWALIEMNAIVSDLYSALDSLANEINIVYELELDIRNVAVFHNSQEHGANFNKKCVRCRLAKEHNDSFTAFLEHELEQQWFLDFHETRRQLVHLHQPIYNVTLSMGDHDFPDEATVLLIPNEPCKENPQMNDYSKGLDFNTYSQECRINVATLIEEVYKKLEPKVRALPF